MANAFDAERWIFSEGGLASSREAAHERALQLIRAAPPDGGERRQGARDPPKALSREEESRFFRFYLQQFSNICAHCHAPPEVRWTAIMFYSRFYAVRSPMEFDPMPIMFACVHLACKIEEVHEITLDKLLSSTDMRDEAMKTKISGLELPLLEAINFALLVEPKPDSALSMLKDEVESLPAWSALISNLPLTGMALEAVWREVLTAADVLILDLSIFTDAILCVPPSVLITAALGVALSRHAQLAASQGDPLLEMVLSLLLSHAEGEAQKSAIRKLFNSALQEIDKLTSAMNVTDEAVKDLVRSLRRCNRACERLREEADERSEANRKERKRRWGEMKGAIRRQVPTPLLQGLADFNNRFSSSMAADGAEDFVIHRPREDIDM